MNNNIIIAYSKKVPIDFFADLDGTLIKTASGRTFAKDKNDWVIRKDVVKALQSFGPRNLFIVSNQGGIEKHIISRDDIIEKFDNIVKELKKYLPTTNIEYMFCESNDRTNPFRKPNTGMIDDIRTRHPEISLCIMIGDASGKPGQFSDSDKLCAENADIPYIDVEDFVANSLEFSRRYKGI